VLDTLGVFLYTDYIMMTKIKMTKKQLKEDKEHNKQVRKAFRQIDKLCKRFNISRVEFIKKALL
jgi:hypothetical protein